MQQLVKGAVRFCQMPRFWQFLSRTGDTVTNEAEAAVALRRRCGIASRSELNTNTEAQSRYTDLIFQFNRYCIRHK